MISSIIKRISQTNVQHKDSIILYLIALSNDIPIKNINNITPEDLSIISKLGIIKRYPEGVDIDVSTLSIKEVVNTRWKEYQCLFSKDKRGKVGLKEKCMSSESEIKTKLIRFMTGHPDVTFDDVLKATEWYVEKFMRINNFTLMRSASYFIYKEVTEGGFKVLKSDLEEALRDCESNKDSEQWSELI